MYKVKHLFKSKIGTSSLPLALSEVEQLAERAPFDINDAEEVAKITRKKDEIVALLEKSTDITLLEKAIVNKNDAEWNYLSQILHLKRDEITGKPMIKKGKFVLISDSRSIGIIKKRITELKLQNQNTKSTAPVDQGFLSSYAKFAGTTETSGTELEPVNQNTKPTATASITRMGSIFSPPDVSLSKFLLCVVKNQTTEAETMLEENPALVLSRGTVISPEGRKFTNATALEIALLEWNNEMAAMMKKYFAQLGQVGVDAWKEQYSAIFPHGFEAILEQQKKQNIFDFSDIVAAIENAGEEAARLKLASDEEGQQSTAPLTQLLPLIQAVQTFREQFAQKIASDVYFNPQDFKQALTHFGEKYNVWGESQRRLFFNEAVNFIGWPSNMKIEIMLDYLGKLSTNIGRAAMIQGEKDPGHDVEGLGGTILRGKAELGEIRINDLLSEKTKALTALADPIQPSPKSSTFSTQSMH